MLSVILCDGYLEARHSAFERIGTVTSCRVCDMAPDSAVAPQPVTVPFNPAKVFAEKNNKSFFTWFYAIDIFFSFFFLSKAFRNIILIKKIKSIWKNQVRKSFSRTRESEYESFYFSSMIELKLAHRWLTDYSVWKQVRKKSM